MEISDNVLREPLNSLMVRTEESAIGEALEALETHFKL